MADIAGALRSATADLRATSDSPRLDAEVLLAFAMGCTREDLLLGRTPGAVPPIYDAFVARRAAHEPVAYITGHQEFWGLDFHVSPDVLIPRPDSETLIDHAVQRFAADRALRILDMGTGSGCLLLAALSHFENATGIGVDASAAALIMAGRNAVHLGLEKRAEFVQADWRAPGWQSALRGPFDLILANPPYVETQAHLSPDVADYEPHGALFAGADGMDDYHILMPQWGDLLSAEGQIFLEIGHNQAAAVSQLARKFVYSIEIKKDLSGHDRMALIGMAG